MIRVAHIVKAVGIAGAEKHLLTLLPALDRSQFDVGLIVLTEPGKPVAELISEARARRVPTKRLVILGDADPTMIPRLAYWLRRLYPDLVHTHLVHADFHGAFGARLARVPVVISSRHNDDPFRQRAIMAYLVGLASRHVDHLVAISEHVRGFTLETEGVPPERVTTVHYGLELREPAAFPDVRRQFGLGPGPVIACVARLAPQKGHQNLLTAFQYVVRQVPDAQLLLVGDGELRGKLVCLTRDLGLTESVVFTGWRTDACDLLYGVDLFVLPSLWEGFGLVLLEAMAASLPIVATRVGAIPEIVLHGKTGWLVAGGDEANLAAGIVKLLNSPQERAELGRRGRLRLESEFRVQGMVAATEALYQRLLSRERSSTLRRRQRVVVRP